MGNTRSWQWNQEAEEDIWWSNSCENTVQQTVRQMSDENAEKLSEFKLELARKHEKRRELLAEKRKEMQNIREEVDCLRKENLELRNNGDNVCSNSSSSSSKSSSVDTSSEITRLLCENEELKNKLMEKETELITRESLTHKNNELRVSIAEMQQELQNLNAEVMDFQRERQDYNAHVVALKDVITVSKQMLQIREAQLKELKQKIDSIEESLAGKEMNILSQDLRNEYERQLENIRLLRTLYEERQRADRKEKEELSAKLEETKKELQDQQTKTSELELRITELESENSIKYDTIKSLESNLGLANAESRQYQAELTVINQLFSEILLGFNNTHDIDLDKLTRLLKENHGLLQNIVVNEVSTEVSSALPKVLLDLLSQIASKETTEDTGENKLQSSESHSADGLQMNSTEEIVQNLPKVWRVLIELLNHQKAPFNDLTDDEDEENKNPCYKIVETAKGPSSVVSVSQTYIRLKDLILEKKSLEKETNNLKQLNTHLENRLQDQEKRLEMVGSELTKTWHVVGKLQKQHQLLHTQEKILRYELAQKRKLLTELKEELEYSREKWQQAREKNSTTEEQWKQLRSEFAARRIIVADDLNNSSVESGYSDERECSSSDDEPGYETDVSEGNQKTSISEEAECSHMESISKEAECNQAVPFSEEPQCNIKESTSEKTECKLDNINENGQQPEEQILNLDSTEGQNTNELDEQRTESTREDNDHSTAVQSKTDLFPSNEKTDSTKTEEVLPNPSDIQTQPSTSQCLSDKPTRTLEEVLAARDERLKRLESQCQQLVTKVTNTTNRSVVISKKLDNLHEVYGDSSNNVQANTSEANNDQANNVNANNADATNEEPSENAEETLVNDDRAEADLHEADK